MKMRYLFNFFRILICIIAVNNCFAQTKVSYVNSYNKLLNGNYAYNSNVIKGFSKGNNAYNYIALCYYIDANNIMYKKTSDLKYLDYNIQVFNAIHLSDNTQLSSRRTIKVNSKNQNANSNGKESVNFEGYYYRYLGEFIDIIKSKGIYEKDQVALTKVLIGAFDTWPTNAMYHQRIHIGANWATVALFLYKFTKNAKYKKFSDGFDEQLKTSLVTKMINNKPCYIWNMTYPNSFIKDSQKRKLNYPLIQDASHGNHVVNYIITSYELKTGAWNRDDLLKLSNTVENLLWNSNNKTFSDNVDGSKSSDNTLRNTGWKQSDGWMKLIKYRSSLLPIYEEYYKANSSKIFKTSFALQYIANLY